MKSFRAAHPYVAFGLRRSSFLCCFFILFYAMYLITGSFMFAALESPIERTLRNRVKEQETQFLLQHECVSKKELEILLDEIVKASKRGITLISNDSYGSPAGESNWSFAQSLFFAVTILTTIGYGHITPISKEGKLFCILYILVGVPLTLVLGTAVVQRLMIPIAIFQRFLHKRLNHILSIFYIKLLHLFIVTTILLIFLLFIPASVFAYIENDWNYLDGLYYCFITMTTVGLGDYIPGDTPMQNYRSLYKLLSTGYLLIAFVCVLLIVNIFNDIPELNIGILFKLEKDERTNDPERAHLNESSSIGRNYTECSTSDMMICDRGGTPIQDESSTANSAT